MIDKFIVKQTLKNYPGLVAKKTKFFQPKFKKIVDIYSMNVTRSHFSLEVEKSKKCQQVFHDSGKLFLQLSLVNRITTEKGLKSSINEYK